jgi:hypothetical protein
MQNAIVEHARPLLNPSYEAKLITRDEYKDILKKVAAKIIQGYRTQHTRPPARCAVPESQAAAIQRMIGEYVDYTRKQWS